MGLSKVRRYKLPQQADPTQDQEVATKKYVDDSAGGGSGVWVELKRASLGAPGTTLDVTTVALKKYVWLQILIQCDALLLPQLRFNSDVGTNYLFTRCADGAAAVKTNNQSSLAIATTTRSSQYKVDVWITNLALEEKVATFLAFGKNVGDNTNNSLTDGGGSWINTVDLITAIQILAMSTMGVDSEIVVLHHD